MNHLKQIAARLPEYGLDAMLLNSEPGEYYAVGFHGEGNVVVTAQGCFYFTDSRYIEAANHLITGAEIAMTGRSRNYRAMVQEVVDRCRIRKLGFEEGYLSVADYNLWKEGLTAELVPAQKLVDALRAAKDDGEIALMTKAQEITDRAFSEILKFIQPGMGAAFVRTKMKNVITGGVTETSFNPTAKFEQAFVERKDMEYSYNDGDLYYFMDMETFDMLPISKDLLGDSFRFVKENMSCKVMSYKGSVFGVEPPTFVELEVTETDPGFKGDTATNVTKPATLETGAEIKVPLFINPGDKIKIDTRTGEYLERCKG